MLMSNLYVFKNFTELDEQASEEILKGRNDEYVRRWMSSNRLITLDEHQRFMASLKGKTNRIYLRVERAGYFVGVYSITDIENGVGVGGFWVTAYARERLLSLSMAFHSISHVFEACTLDCIRGYQLNNNQTVARMNALLGFVPVAPPVDADPRMTYLEMTRSYWEQTASRRPKLMTLIELAENMHEDERI